MPIEAYLTHRVSRVRKVAVLEEDGVTPALDDYGRRVTTDDIEPAIPVAIQPKSAREKAAFHQAGVPVVTHTIFAVDRSITAADAIVHDPAACPVVADLPAGRYELSGARDAAGLGHHLEIDAVLITSPEPGESSPPGSGGSGSGS